MGYAEKVYVAVQNGETKIEIHVSKMEGGYMAVMVPVASGDTRLRSLFKGHKIPKEIGTTIEFAIAACEMWIKDNLGQDVAVFEKKVT
jgi:hypothetical protein